MPSQFGVIAEMTAIVFIIEKIAEGGLGSALIQKKETDREDISTVFVSSMCLS